jgi:D-alanyl-lipoteichoic acid acyltransferase DltB (MBOAT superfamily)
MSGLTLALAFLYVVLGAFVLRRWRGQWREFLFAALNLAVFFWLFFYGRNKRELAVFVVYLGIVLAQYVVMRWYATRKDATMWVAFFVPILALIFIRYVPASAFAGVSHKLADFLRDEPGFTFAPYFVGLSYLAFRTSHLVLEVNGGAIEKPGLWAYLGFCFFVPTMAVGPINPYQTYRLGFASAPPSLPIGRSLIRIIVGLVKFQFFGKLCDQLSYSGLLLDDHYHPWIDFPVAAVFFYLFLYCNFAGYCDVAIGVAGLVGIPVEENFQNPFAARNVKDFWNRWHITLSNYMKEVVFNPLSKSLAHLLGPANINHAIAMAIAVVFLLIGIWHGVGWNFFIFGALHALGCVVNQYYTIGLKRWLGRDGFKAYNSNRWIHAAAVVVTFCYVSATMFFFANSVPEMKIILSALR